MTLVVIGSGAREHAMAWALSRELAAASTRSSNDRVICIPGNAGTEPIARNLQISPEDTKAVVSACRELHADLVLIGPEDPLAAGLVDALQNAGIPSFGPSRKAAALEASKSFARAFSIRHGIPCALTERFSATGPFIAFLEKNRGTRLVLKKSGLAAGKGVLESDYFPELASFGEAVLQSDELLIEEFLYGRELSIFALYDGSDRLILPPCADHKKAQEGDKGQNTGGMGAVCPVPFADAGLLARIEKEIVDPTFRGMDAEGLAYRGVLFFGIMVTTEGPKLLEYNVRFGDPETQSLLPLLQSSFIDLCASTAKGSLHSHRPKFSSDIACGVVVAAPGYPGSYPKGLAVEVDELPEDGISVKADPFESILYHASTSRDPAGNTRTGGGRCFTAVGIGADWKSARERAYRRAKTVRFAGAWSRPDIGGKIFGS